MPHELGRLMAADVDASPYLAEVAASLADEDPCVRQMAAAVLGRIGAPAVRPLCRCLTASEDGLRAIAAFALARIGAAAVPALRLMLQFSDPRTVAAAAGALSQIGLGARESVADLEATAPGAPLAVQMACAAAVVRISGDANRGLPLLLRALDHPEPPVRQQSLERITELGPAAHPAIPRILQCTADPTPEVRAAAALTLGRIRAPASEVVSPMVHLLDDASPDVRLNAMIVLASWGEAASAALPALRRWAGHPDEKTSAAASAAIERIETPQPGGGLNGKRG